MLPSHPLQAGSLVGARIGNYLARRMLGAGAMGEVYLGEHPEIGREVAIKVLAPRLCNDPQMSERFVAEARAVNRIKHPNIIQIFDFARLPDGRLYYTMEVLEGRELSDLLAERAPLPVHEVDELLRQIASALDAAHAAGIVHRDLKPGNIFVCDTPSGPFVKILDFGIAKLMQPELDSVQRTATGMILGTPLYMSPEQAAGRVKDISPRTDVYSLGVIIFQMLSGTWPIVGPNTAQVIAKHITDPPISLAAVTRGLPAALSQVVERSLAKEPGQRQQRAGELYEAFHAAISRTALGLTATALPTPEPMPEAAPAQPTTLGGAAAEALAGSLPRPEQSRGTGRAVIVALAVVAALVVGGAAFLLTRSSGSRDGGSRHRAASMTPADGAADARVPVVSPRPAGRPYRIQVNAVEQGVWVEVQVDGQTRFVKVPPFIVTVRGGSSLTVRARREGFADIVKSWKPDRDQAIYIAWDPGRAGRRRGRISVRRYRPRPRPGPVPVPEMRLPPAARPRPRPGVVRQPAPGARPRTSRRPAPRPRPRGMTMYGNDIPESI